MMSDATALSARHRTPTPDDDPGGSDRQRHKRRRIEDGASEQSPSPAHEPPPPTPAVPTFPTSSRISTWEFDPDLISDVQRQESLQASPSTIPVDQPIATSSSASAPTRLPDPTPPPTAGRSSDADADDKPAQATPEPLSAYTCPICFSPPTNATLTPCGHVCCGQCLFTAVKATIRRNMVVAMDRAPAARCPVCRAEIAGWDGRGGGVIGLNMRVLYSL